jgi:hypothetical protein
MLSIKKKEVRTITEDQEIYEPEEKEDDLSEAETKNEKAQKKLKKLKIA